MFIVKLCDYIDYTNTFSKCTHKYRSKRTLSAIRDNKKRFWWIRSASSEKFHNRKGDNSTTRQRDNNLLWRYRYRVRHQRSTWMFVENNCWQIWKRTLPLSRSSIINRFYSWSLSLITERVLRYQSLFTSRIVVWNFERKHDQTEYTKF